MSFLSVLKGIGKVVLSPTAVTLESALFPPAAPALAIASGIFNGHAGASASAPPGATAGSLAGVLSTSVVKAELAKLQQGITSPQAQALVVSDIAEWLGMVNTTFLGNTGQKLEGNGEALLKAIDMYVAALNQIAEYQKSIQLVKDSTNG